jgi:hypothetical protein
LEAVSESLKVPITVEELAPVTPDEVARQITSPLIRRRVVQAMVLTAMVDGEATDDEVSVVRKFTEALGVDPDYARSLRQVAGRQMIRLRIDFLRRGPIPGQLMKAWDEAGAGGVWKVLAPFTGHTDHDMAWRYKHLGLLPRHTLGHVFWEHMTRNRFAFPGEPDGLGEAFVRHDLVHTLAGYGTDPLGELCVASFTAANSGEHGTFVRDPFFYLFSSIVVYHMGMKIRPLFPPYEGFFDSRAVVHAFERGNTTARDLMDDSWDYWSDMEKPIDDVSAAYQVPPL